MTWPLAGLHWITPDWPAPANVFALTTLRGIVDMSGDVSGAVPDGYGGFNLAHHVNDDPVRVKTRRDNLQYALGLQHIQWLDQVHGINVADANHDNKTQCADAVYTVQKNLACAVLTADCLPVVFTSRSGGEIAVAHAGWRGLCAGVLETTVQRFAADACELIAWLGPAIGPQVFEVGPEVRDAFIAATPLPETRIHCAFIPSPTRATHFIADIYALARLRLCAAGVTAIYGGGFCTVSDKRFYSWRRAPVTGRMATLVMMR